MTAPDLLPWMWNLGSDPQVDDDLMEKWLYSAMLHPSKLKPTMHKLVQHLSGDKERVVPNNRATPADRIAALTEQLAAARKDAEEAEAYAAELEANLATAVELALKECPFRWGTPSYDKWWQDRRTIIAELTGGKDE